MLRLAAGRERGRIATRWPVAWMLTGVLSLACGNGDGFTYQVPTETDDGWATGSVDDVGMVAAPLESLLRAIAGTDNHSIHSAVIVKDQRLVFEHYWDGIDIEVGTLEPVERSFDRDTLHYVASVSKSVTSALAGIALDQLLLESVDAPLFSLFPDHVDLRNDDNAGITLKHLLAFSSGLDWNEFEYGFDDPRDSHYQMFDTDDPVAHLLSRPVVFQPGSRFLYNSGDTNLVGEAVRTASLSSSLAAFAEASLFGPLGIASFDWWTFPRAGEITFASGGLSLRPRDMAKLGALYVAEGSWKGVPVVSPAWVQASTAMSTDFDDGTWTYGYGYNWWLGRFRFGDGTVDFYCAMGWGGQYIYVVPDLALVIVFTAGGFWEELPLAFGDLVEDYILVAITPPS